MRKGVGGRRRAQQLLGAAAAQAVLTGVGGPHGFWGAPHTPALSAEGTPAGAHSLSDGGARDHGVVLTDEGPRRERERGRCVGINSYSNMLLFGLFFFLVLASGKSHVMLFLTFLSAALKLVICIVFTLIFL